MKKEIKKIKNLSGLKLATLYGMMPNKLGFCGSKKNKEQEILNDFLKGKIASAKIRSVLKKFEAAYAYYDLIAKENGIRDPLSEKVVEAYWIGNNLLERVNKLAIEKMIFDKFTKPGLLSKIQAKERVKRIPKNSKPHHSFHVFILGTITERVNLSPIKLKDVCRVSWGEVIRINDHKAELIVEYRPVVKDKQIKLGVKRKKRLKWDKKIIDKIKIGDWISFHWDMVTQVLTEKKVKSLMKYTQNTLKRL
jgi:hypothetical protein